MIKKLIYSYVLTYKFNSESEKRDYRACLIKKYCYGDDEHCIDGIDYYSEYNKSDKAFYGYLFNSEDLDKCVEFASDEYIINSTKKLTNKQIIEVFEAFMAHKVESTVLHLHEVYLDIKDALEKGEKEND